MNSNTEILLNAIINGEDVSDFVTKSRMEEYLKRIATQESLEGLDPQSRVEYLLNEIAKTGGGVGGGGSSGDGNMKKWLDLTKTCRYIMRDLADLTTTNGIFGGNDTANVTNMEYMFYNCKSLTEVAPFDTKNVTNMRGMFYYCKSLTTVPLFDTSNVTDMWSMFDGCDALTTVPLFDTSNVTSMYSMFSYCRALTEVPPFDVSKVTSLNSMFYLCTSLKSILMYGMQISFSIANSNKYEASDLVTVLSNCQVVTTSQKLTMNSNNLAKLNNIYVKETGVEPYDGLALRPCVICESTDEGAMLATDYFTGKGWTLA